MLNARILLDLTHVNVMMVMLKMDMLVAVSISLCNNVKMCCNLFYNNSKLFYV